MKTTVLQTDFCVVGGGLSGVCAALAAARNGASVVLVQNRSVLGGNSSSEMRLQIVGANRRRPGARESGLIEELRLDDAFLPGVANTDPGDLARLACVRASGHLPDHPPEQVIDGITRDPERAGGAGFRGPGLLIFL